MKFKKIIAMLLTLSMVLAMCSFTASADAAADFQHAPGPELGCLPGKPGRRRFRERKALLCILHSGGIHSARYLRGADLVGRTGIKNNPFPARGKGIFFRAYFESAFDFSSFFELCGYDRFESDRCENACCNFELCGYYQRRQYVYGHADDRRGI